MKNETNSNGFRFSHKFKKRSKIKKVLIDLVIDNKLMFIEIYKDISKNKRGVE